MAARIAGVGLVTVSERMSMMAEDGGAGDAAAGAGATGADIDVDAE